MYEPSQTLVHYLCSGGGRYFRRGGGGKPSVDPVSRFALPLTLLVNAYGYVIEHL